MWRVFAWIIAALALGAILLAAASLAALRSKKRQDWAPVLERETARWKAKSYEELLSELKKVQAYEVELGAKRYQVEVELLENTLAYLNVAIAVDDGTLPASLAPLTKGFIRRKGEAQS